MEVARLREWGKRKRASDAGFGCAKGEGEGQWRAVRRADGSLWLIVDIPVRWHVGESSPLQGSCMDLRRARKA